VRASSLILLAVSVVDIEAFFAKPGIRIPSTSRVLDGSSGSRSRFAMPRCAVRLAASAFWREGMIHVYGKERVAL
jgi:hypothetical protein